MCAVALGGSIGGARHHLMNLLSVYSVVRICRLPSVLAVAKEHIPILSAEFWAQIEPLLPKHNPRKGRPSKLYRRAPGGGRLAYPNKQMFETIVYILRSGRPWKKQPKFVGTSSAHKYFQRWRRDGFFMRFWKAGLAESVEMERISWRYQRIDRPTGKWSHAWGPYLEFRQRRKSRKR